MVIQIQKNASAQEIKSAVEEMMKKKQKVKKGYPDLDIFFGLIEPKDFVALQKQLRDEWS